MRGSGRLHLHEQMHPLAGPVGILLFALACSEAGPGNRAAVEGGVQDGAPEARDAAPEAAKDQAVERNMDVALEFLSCIEDWPTPGGPHARKPSLPGESPKILWRSLFPGHQTGSRSDGGPVLSADRLAFHASDWVHFVNKDGSKPQKKKYNGLGWYASALVADLDGNVYYSTPDGLFSVDANAELRWSVSAAPPANTELAAGIPPVLGPDGVVYFATLDKWVVALRASDGQFLWSRPPPSTNVWWTRVMGGGGNALFVGYESAYPNAHTDALDKKDGKVLGSFVRPAYGASFTWGWGAWIEGWDYGIGYGNIYVFDTCGRMRLSGVPPGSGLMVPGELLALATSSQSGTLVLLDTAGNTVGGPAPAEGAVIAVGADGTIYTFRCQDADNAINRILAYSYDLQELWRLELGSAIGCPGITGNVVLDDSGVMFLTRPGDPGTDSTEVVAIQTASPGLADSSWPSLRHDNRGTAWLVPGSSSPSDSDGGTTAPIDAPQAAKK
jgi:outer membrane protein assembly factor BamB